MGRGWRVLRTTMGTHPTSARPPTHPPTALTYSPVSTPPSQGPSTWTHWRVGCRRGGWIPRGSSPCASCGRATQASGHVCVCGGRVRSLQWPPGAAPLHRPHPLNRPPLPSLSPAAVGHQMGWGVRLLSRGAKRFSTPLHIEVRGCVLMRTRGECTRLLALPPACAGTPHSPRAPTHQPIGSITPRPPLHPTPLCPPTGQPGLCRGARGCGAGWRQRDHRVLQPAGAEGAAHARLVCKEGEAAPPPSAPAAQAGRAV